MLYFTFVLAIKVSFIRLITESATPSADLSNILPVNPSHMIISVYAFITSLASTFPIKFKSNF